MRLACLLLGLALALRADDEPKVLALTQAEQVQLELVRTRRINAELRYQLALTQLRQIQDEHQRLSQEERKLFLEFAKAHGLDPLAHELHADGKKFVAKTEVKK